MFLPFVLHNGVVRKGGNHTIDIMPVRGGEIALQRSVQFGGHVVQGQT
jgi:hypothetical protein